MASQYADDEETPMVAGSTFENTASPTRANAFNRNFKLECRGWVWLVFSFASVVLSIAYHASSYKENPCPTMKSTVETHPTMKSTVETHIHRAGSAYGGWQYNELPVKSDSIVYSVGIGEDASFDAEISQRHGCTVWGFDPTPKSVTYVEEARKKGELTENFVFLAEGLATQKGVLTFTKPKNKHFVSMRQGKIEGMGDTIDVPVNKLENWMHQLGHRRIDILKLDIEGAEYDILEDWIADQWFPFDQLLVEFHYRFLPNDNKSRHGRVLAGLYNSGFERIATHGSVKAGEEMTFQRRRC